MRASPPRYGTEMRENAKRFNEIRMTAEAARVTTSRRTEPNAVTTWLFVCANVHNPHDRCCKAFSMRREGPNRFEFGTSTMMMTVLTPECNTS